jgi:hypothetical protein
LLQPSAKLYTLSLVRNTPYVRKAALLASGTVLHGFRKSQWNEPIPPAVYREHIERYTKEMQELYRQSQDESEKVAILKAISNSGIPEFLQFLRECIDQSPSLPVRINAVMAMRRMPQEWTLKVRTLNKQSCIVTFDEELTSFYSLDYLCLHNISCMVQFQIPDILQTHNQLMSTCAPIYHPTQIPPKPNAY